MNIKILQWNILWTEKIENIVSALKKIDADIICLQELTRGAKVNNNIDTAMFVAKELDFHYFYQDAQVWPSGEKQAQGNAVFSRFPITDSRCLFLQESKPNPKDATEEGRTYTECTIEIERKKIQVATVHLSFTPRFEYTKERKHETENLINIIKNKEEQFVLMGDFNASPESEVMRQILPYLKDCGPSFDQKTWSTKPFEKKGFVVNDLNWRIDYVLSSPDIKVVSSEIIKTDYSDHLPVLVTFEV